MFSGCGLSSLESHLCPHSPVTNPGRVQGGTASASWAGGGSAVEDSHFLLHPRPGPGAVSDAGKETAAVAWELLRGVEGTRPPPRCGPCQVPAPAFRSPRGVAEEWGQVAAALCAVVGRAHPLDQCSCSSEVLSGLQLSAVTL